MKVERNIITEFSSETPGSTRRTGVAGSLTVLLKKLRISQPFNRIATSSVRSVLRAGGLHSESVTNHLHRIGMVHSKLPNGSVIRLWSRADDWVSNQVYWRGWEGYEPETVPLFFRLATRARVTFDVGAYVGFFSLLAAHANPNGQVYAFEPLPDACERLQKNVALNNLTNVHCVASAVGDVEGTAEFFSTSTQMPCSSSLSYEFMRSADKLCRFPVPVITLDGFVRDRSLDRIDLLKVDTESTEPQVLRGMIETIRRDKPLIICEVLNGRGSEEVLQELLGGINYRSYHLTPQGAVLRDHIEGHPEWLNYLFTELGPSEVAQL